MAKRRAKITDYHLDFIRDNLGKMKPTEIAKELGVSHVTIYREINDPRNKMLVKVSNNRPEAVYSNKSYVA